jgi:hypothetical protein
MTAPRSGPQQRLIRRGAPPFLAIPMSLFLSFVTVAQAVFAEDCIPQTAAFPPGHWVASGISVDREDVDELSVLLSSESGAFGVDVDPAGGASGTFSMVGEGAIEMIGSDEGYAAASWLKTGEITGTASLLQVDGEIDLQISGAVDVSPNHDNDPIVGEDVYDFENHITRPFSMQFSPSAANCNQVFGSLDGPVEYGTSTPQSFFIAVRTSGRAQEADVQGQLALLLERAQDILNMDPQDTEVLRTFVYDMLAFESLLASLESCDVGNELDMGAAWGMLQSVMFNVMHHFLGAALGGEYSTRDVITAVGIWIQGGSLGWRGGGGCLDPNTASDGAMDLFVKFEDVLLERLLDAGDADRSLIAAAAYQYGLPRVIAALEGN